MCGLIASWWGLWRNGGSWVVWLFGLKRMEPCRPCSARHFVIHDCLLLAQATYLFKCLLPTQYCDYTVPRYKLSTTSSYTTPNFQLELFSLALFVKETKSPPQRNQFPAFPPALVFALVPFSEGDKQAWYVLLSNPPQHIFGNILGTTMPRVELTSRSPPGSSTLTVPTVG